MLGRSPHDVLMPSNCTTYSMHGRGGSLGVALLLNFQSKSIISSAGASVESTPTGNLQVRARAFYLANLAGLQTHKTYLCYCTWNHLKGTRKTESAQDLNVRRCNFLVDEFMWYNELRPRTPPKNRPFLHFHVGCHSLSAGHHRGQESAVPPEVDGKCGRNNRGAVGHLQAWGLKTGKRNHLAISFR